MNAPVPTPTPKVTRGRRYCPKCNTVRRHSATRRLSVVGRRMLWLAGFITIGLCVHSYVRFSPGTPALWMLWVLPPLAAFILVTLALRHQSFEVRCTQCDFAETKVSAPRWVDDPAENT